MLLYALSAVIFMLAWREGSSFRCYNCTGVISPSSCSDVIQCQDDEVCKTRKYTEPGRDDMYDLGCSAPSQNGCHRMSRSVRAAQGHYQIEFWSSCCHGDFCNARFDDKGNLKDVHPLECHSCSGISDPSTCNATTLCNHGDFCSTHEETDSKTGLSRYYMGCLSKKTCETIRMQPSKRRPMCRGCCDDESRCNSKICPVTTITTTVASIVDPFRNARLVVTPGHQKAEYKSQTRISCQLDGVTDAIPDLAWYHVTSDGKRKGMMKGSGNRLIMVIPEADRASCGTYECIASLGGRQVQAKAAVDLADFVDITTPPYSMAVKQGVAVIQKTITIAAGSDVKLPCNADGIPAPYISWTIQKRRQPLMTVGAGNSRFTAPMPILNMQAKYQGIYTCIASNSYGTVKEAVLVRMGS